ncbi:putative F-box protein [Cardamine amara subsp. amara]|uniref:F-box protein n=1 Tax=Cardamine amara subsp. amara TaxID=228776 RepID=A0ABD1BR44_CARAN
MSNKGKQRRFKRIPSRRKSNHRPNPTTIYIPLDLQISILLRLPVKSLKRFQCVSKLWSSIITSRDFRKQHFNIAASSSSPRLLITFKDFNDKKLLLVMLPNPNASSSSSCRVPYRDLSLVKVYGKMVNNTVWGLISLRIGVNEGICNPSTRLLDDFPQQKYKIINAGFGPRPKYCFGYDPVEDQYKVLAVDQLSWRAEHKVLVVGGEGGWRDVSCVVSPHWAYTSGLYMNGFIYYGAVYQPILISSPDDSIIVCFNVRLETFSIIKVPSKVVPDGYESMWVDTLFHSTDKILINYEGRIGVVENPREGSFRMWVVEDAEKEEWSMNTYHLPQSAAGLNFKVMETFHNGEICMVSKVLSDPFSLFFYNLKTKSMRSVVIEGLPISKLEQVVTVSDHYENFTSSL